jgi:hypothetical protein
LQQESVVSALQSLESKALEVVMKGDVVLDPESLEAETPALKPVKPAMPEPAPEPALAASPDAELLEMLG